MGYICASYISNVLSVPETHMLANGSGVFSDYIVFSFGTLVPLSLYAFHSVLILCILFQIAFVLILPLSLIHLPDNIKFQVASFILLLCITVIWIAYRSMFTLSFGLPCSSLL